MAISTMARLRAVYRPPAARAGLKVLDHLDVHCRNFIALSPFYVISSARADGRADASPRGDPPGSLAYNGRAEISTEPELLKPLAIEGRLPIAVLKVTVEEAFLHCVKALIRARLWERDAQVERSCFPTYGRVLADQIAGADAAEIDTGEAESARTELF